MSTIINLRIIAKPNRTKRGFPFICLIAFYQHSYFKQKSGVLADEIKAK